MSESGRSLRYVSVLNCSFDLKLVYVTSIHRMKYDWVSNIYKPVPFYSLENCGNSLSQLCYLILKVHCYLSFFQDFSS